MIIKMHTTKHPFTDSHTNTEYLWANMQSASDYDPIMRLIFRRCASLYLCTHMNLL